MLHACITCASVNSEITKRVRKRCRGRPIQIEFVISLSEIDNCLEETVRKYITF